MKQVSVVSFFNQNRLLLLQVGSKGMKIIDCRESLPEHIFLKKCSTGCGFLLIHRKDNCISGIDYKND